MANRAYRYRIYPNQAQRQAVVFVLGVTRKFYNCGTTHDRDINAAKNILAKGIEKLSAPISAVVAEHTCGGVHKRRGTNRSGSNEVGIMEQIH